MKKLMCRVNDHCLIICSETESSRLKLFHALPKSQSETRMLLPEALITENPDFLILFTKFSQKVPTLEFLTPLLHEPDNSHHYSWLLFCSADCSPRIPNVVCSHILCILCSAFLATFSPPLLATYQYHGFPHLVPPNLSFLPWCISQGPSRKTMASTKAVTERVQ